MPRRARGRTRGPVAGTRDDDYSLYTRTMRDVNSATIWAPCAVALAGCGRPRRSRAGRAPVRRIRARSSAAVRQRHHGRHGSRNGGLQPDIKKASSGLTIRREAGIISFSAQAEDLHQDTPPPHRPGGIILPAAIPTHDAPRSSSSSSTICTRLPHTGASRPVQRSRRSCPRRNMFGIVSTGRPCPRPTYDRQR